ncbi:MAG: rane protein [Firmicutes bacterium]|nr:rane protein [Bacillota bacterium]
MNSNNSKASVIARGGMLTALGVLFVYLSSVLPTSRMFLEGLTSCLILASIILMGAKNSIAVYAATAVLSFLVCGLRLTTIAYVLVFGLYGFVKYYIEGLNNIVLEYALKLIYCNVCLAVLFLIYKLFLPNLFDIKAAVYIIVIAAQFVFLIYDYALSAFATYFRKRYGKLNIR